MTLVTYYDSKLYHMNVKIIFSNEDLDKKIYIDQPIGFAKKEKKEVRLINLENLFITLNKFLDNDI